MNLAAGETIFDQMNTTYDELRYLDDPVGSVVKYYKSQMKDGERLWWAGSTDEESIIEVDELKVRLASVLTPQERQLITAEGIALFPEVLGKGQQKYSQFVLWVAAEHRVVSPSTRDFFSAGGQGTISTNRAIFTKMPQIVVKINAMKDRIHTIINSSNDVTLCQTWRVDKTEHDRIGQWINIITRYCDTFGVYSSREVLNAIFER